MSKKANGAPQAISRTPYVIVVGAGNAIAAASTTLSQEATLPDLERD